MNLKSWLSSLRKPAQETPQAQKGNYLLARAKRELERRLRQEGASRAEAATLVAKHFKTLDL